MPVISVGTTSSTGAETTVSDGWLEGTLINDTAVAALVAGRVYEGLAPLNIPYPFIVWNLQSPRDIRGNSAARIMVECQYLVRAYAEVNKDRGLAGLAKAIDAALNGKEEARTDGYILQCVRESPYSMMEEHDGKQLRALGGMYTVLVQGH